MNSETYSSLWQKCLELGKLYITNAKLTLSEKLTRLLTMLAICSLVFVLSVVAFLFISIALVHWISDEVGLTWAYLIMGGIYLVLMVIVVSFKRTLIVNPLARFLSKLLLS